MTHALILDGKVDRLGEVDDTGDVIQLIDGPDAIGFATLADLAKAGWRPVVEQRAALSADQHHGPVAYMIRKDDVVAAYPAEDDPAQQKNERAQRAAVDQLVTNTRAVIASAATPAWGKVVARCALLALRLAAGRFDQAADG